MSKQTGPIRTAIYARVDAGKQGDECAEQVQRLKTHIAQDADRRLMGVYVDDGVPANAYRPEWEKLLADCDAGRYDEILAVSLSRLERKTYKLRQSKERLTRSNVRIVTMQGDHTLLPLISGSVMNDG